MTENFLQQIDWQQPWLKPLRSQAQLILASPDWRGAFNAAASARHLKNHRELPLHFVAQQELPRGTAYETFISATGAVPTRDNPHDFLNALVWLVFPKIKTALNRLQASALESDAPPPHRRGGLRDAATIFDENSALFVSSDTELVDALRAHQWHEIFVQQRACFVESRCEVVLFGHALMEKLITPYKAITAHAWIVKVEPTFFTLAEAERLSKLDAMMAENLAKGLTTADFTPLPVLGVPGWWPKQEALFYADATVFRPRRDKLNSL